MSFEEEKEEEEKEKEKREEKREEKAPLGREGGGCGQLTVDLSSPFRAVWQGGA